MSDEFTVRHVSGNCGNTMPHPYSHPHPHPTSVPAHEHDVKPCPITVTSGTPGDCPANPGGSSVVDCNGGINFDSSDDTANIAVSTDENGVTQVDVTVNLPEETVSPMVDNGNGTLTYTDETGTQTLIVNTDQWATVVDNQDGTYTATNVDGSMATWDVNHTVDTDTWSVLTANDDGSFTFTLPDGTVVEIPAPEPDCCPTLTPNANGTYTWVSGDGSVTFDLDLRQPQMVDNGNGTWTYIPVGQPPILIVDTDTYTTVTDNGDGTYTGVPADGSTPVTWNTTHTVDTDTWTTFSINSDGSTTFIEPGGSEVTIPPTGASNFNINSEGATYDPSALPTAPSTLPLNPQEGYTATEHFANGDVFWTYIGGAWTVAFEHEHCCTASAEVPAAAFGDVNNPTQLEFETWATANAEPNTRYWFGGTEADPDFVWESDANNTVQNTESPSCVAEWKEFYIPVTDGMTTVTLPEALDFITAVELNGNDLSAGINYSFTAGSTTVTLVDAIQTTPSEPDELVVKGFVGCAAVQASPVSTVGQAANGDIAHTAGGNPTNLRVTSQDADSWLTSGSDKGSALITTNIPTEVCPDQDSLRLMGELNGSPAMVDAPQLHMINQKVAISGAHLLVDNVGGVVAWHDYPGSSIEFETKCEEDVEVIYNFDTFATGTGVHLKYWRVIDKVSGVIYRFAQAHSEAFNPAVTGANYMTGQHGVFTLPGGAHELVFQYTMIFGAAQGVGVAQLESTVKYYEY